MAGSRRAMARTDDIAPTTPITSRAGRLLPLPFKGIIDRRQHHPWLLRRISGNGHRRDDPQPEPGPVKDQFDRKLPVGVPSLSRTSQTGVNFRFSQNGPAVTGYRSARSWHLTLYYKCSKTTTVVMPKTPKRRRLSRTEWTIMQLCWSLGRATARQVQDASDGSRDYRTVKTLLDRIARKGFLRIEKLGRLSLFVPSVTRQRALSEVIAVFVDDVLERSVTPLYLHLAERDDLSPEELEFFRRQLETEEES